MRRAECGQLQPFASPAQSGQNQTLLMPTQLPAVYLAYLATNGTFEGLVHTADGERNVILWDSEEAESANAAMEVNAQAPGFFAFGGDGGGEVYAFDEQGAVFMLPMIGMEPATAVPVAGDFLEFSHGFRRGDTTDLG